IIDQNVGMMFRQFFPIPGPGGDGDGAGAERSSAGDVTRCIANDVDLVRGKFAPVLFHGPSTGKCSQLIPIVMVVGEGAELKKVPDAVVAEFELCSAGNVAGEQPKNKMFSRFESFKKLKHAWKKIAFATWQ